MDKYKEAMERMDMGWSSDGWPKTIEYTLIGLAILAFLIGMSAPVSAQGLFPVQINEIFSQARCSQVVTKRYYAACYDYDFKGPLANGYTLYGDQVSAVNIKNRPRFYEEYSIPKRYRSHFYDYRGFDRGHLRPDAATDWDTAALTTTYSLVNIVPQYKYLNRKMWSKAERYARYMAIKFKVLGVINVVEYPQRPQRIGRNKIAVPDGFYKVLYTKNRDFMRCFYYKNRNYSYEEAQSDQLRDHIIDCNRVPMPGR